jgi:hypothetical protein
MENKIIRILAFIIVLLFTFTYAKDYFLPLSKPSVTNDGLPTPTPSVTPETISISSPKLNETITNPLVIQGQAYVSSSLIYYRLKTSKNQVIKSGSYTVTPHQTSPFEITLSYPEPATEYGVIEVYTSQPSSNKALVIVKFP